MRTAAVIGTGAMGPEVAAAFAGAGMTVTIAGRDAARAAEARERAVALGARPGAVTAGPIGPEAVAGADLVLETVSEDLALKRDLLPRLEGWCPGGAVIATNTSSLRIADLAEPLRDPSRFAGLHFLKPAHLTAVVEVIPGPATAPGAVESLSALAGRMGKEPLLVRRDIPGFIWNRIQFAVLRECLHMLEEGVAEAADIDAAVSDGLAARWLAAGPLATADLGGLRTFAVIAAELFPQLAAGAAVPEVLARHAADGEPLQAWTRERADDVARLRAEALEAGRRIAVRRRQVAG